MPEDAATLDHVIPRTNPLRHKLPYYPKELLVLSCNKCNGDRGRRDDSNLRKLANWETQEDLKKILTDPEILSKL
jgi:5-methylcytosine-specific restriction endonuclease McrA